MDIANSSKLNELIELHNMGALTDKEFAQEKAALINADAPVAVPGTSVTVCSNHPDRRATVQCPDCEEPLCDECEAVCYDLYNQPLCVNCAKIRCKKDLFVSRGKIVTVALTVAAFLYGVIYSVIKGLPFESALILAVILFVIVGGLLGGGLRLYSQKRKSTTIIFGRGRPGCILLIFSLVIWLAKIVFWMIVGTFYVYVGLPGAIKTFRKSKATMAYLEHLEQSPVDDIVTNPNIDTDDNVLSAPTSATGDDLTPSVIPDYTQFGTAIIAYNTNGGSGAFASQTVTKDSNGVARFTLSPAEPTKNGQIFLGWRLGNSMTYRIHKPGDNIAIGTNSATGDTRLTYYAQWSVIEPAIPNPPPAQTAHTVTVRRKQR